MATSKSNAMLQSSVPNASVNQGISGHTVDAPLCTMWDSYTPNVEPGNNYDSYQVCHPFHNQASLPQKVSFQDYSEQFRSSSSLVSPSKRNTPALAGIASSGLLSSNVPSPPKMPLSSTSSISVNHSNGSIDMRHSHSQSISLSSSSIPTFHLSLGSNSSAAPTNHGDSYGNLHHVSPAPVASAATTSATTTLILQKKDVNNNTDHHNSPTANEYYISNTSSKHVNFDHDSYNTIIKTSSPNHQLPCSSAVVRRNSAPAVSPNHKDKQSSYPAISFSMSFASDAAAPASNVLDDDHNPSYDTDILPLNSTIGTTSNVNTQIQHNISSRSNLLTSAYLPSTPTLPLDAHFQNLLAAAETRHEELLLAMQRMTSYFRSSFCTLPSNIPAEVENSTLAVREYICCKQMENEDLRSQVRYLSAKLNAFSSLNNNNILNTTMSSSISTEQHNEDKPEETNTPSIPLPRRGVEASKDSNAEKISSASLLNQAESLSSAHHQPSISPSTANPPTPSPLGVPTPKSNNPSTPMSQLSGNVARLNVFLLNVCRIKKKEKTMETTFEDNGDLRNPKFRASVFFPALRNATPAVPGLVTSPPPSSLSGDSSGIPSVTGSWQGNKMLAKEDACARALKLLEPLRKHLDALNACLPINGPSTGGVGGSQSMANSSGQATNPRHTFGATLSTSSSALAHPTMSSSSGGGNGSSSNILGNGLTVNELFMQHQQQRMAHASFQHNHHSSLLLQSANNNNMNILANNQLNAPETPSTSRSYGRRQSAPPSAITTTISNAAPFHPQIPPRPPLFDQTSTPANPAFMQQHVPPPGFYPSFMDAPLPADRWNGHHAVSAGNHWQNQQMDKRMLPSHNHNNQHLLSVSHAGVRTADEFERFLGDMSGRASENAACAAVAAGAARALLGDSPMNLNALDNYMSNGNNMFIMYPPSGVPASAGSSLLHLQQQHQHPHHASMMQHLPHIGNSM